MSASDEPSTTRYCWAPDDLVLAVELPGALLKRLVVQAGTTAMLYQDVIAILGANKVSASFCRLACKYSHHGAVLVIPDLAVAEMYANGGCLDSMQWIAGVDGRSIAICAVT